MPVSVHEYVADTFHTDVIRGFGLNRLRQTCTEQGEQFNFVHTFAVI